MKPEYNINPIAGNIKGYKHSIESKEKIRIASLGRKHTEAVKQIMSHSCKWVNNPFLGKIHSNKSLALIKAAIAINSDIKTILRREKDQKEKGINTPYKKQYIISVKRK